MFEFLRGIIIDIEPAFLVLDVKGIGFRIQMANPYRLSDQINQETTVYVYQAVSQDNQSLFGFKSKLEKKLFLKLIKVSGIGPKSAMTILANDDYQGFVQAVENEDHAYLTQYPGVGKKTAGQIVLDLKGKLDDFYTAAEPIQQLHENQALEDALEALEALGYSKREISRVEKEFKDQTELSTEAILRQALSFLTSK